MELDLREYLYIDDRVIRQFVEQILDGDVTESQVTTGTNTSASGSLSVRVASAQLGRGAESSRSETVKSTATSRCKQLETLLQEKTSPLGAMDNDAWKTIEPGEFVSANGTLEIPEVARTAALMSSFAAMRPFLSSAKKAEFDEAKEQGEAIDQVLEANGFPVKMRCSHGGPNLMLVVRPSNLTDQMSLLDNAEVSLFGRIRRTIGEGEQLSMSQVMPGLTKALGGQPANRAQRRAAGRKGLKGANDFAIEGPAAEVQALSIYL